MLVGMIGRHMTGRHRRTGTASTCIYENNKDTVKVRSKCHYEQKKMK